ncbi:MAG: hypothetical protein R3E95_09185 [Thiolinea sp.]
MCADLRVLGMDWFDAIAHNLSTVANGGFSTHDASFAWFDSGPLEVAAIFSWPCPGWYCPALVPGSRAACGFTGLTAEFRAYVWILVGTGVLVSVWLAWHDDYDMVLKDLHHGGFQLVFIRGHLRFWRGRFC